MRKITAVFAVLFVCLFFASCSGQSTKDRAIEEVNRNCDVPFVLTLPESELQSTDEYVEIQGFGGYSLENDDVSFTIGGYPDVLNEYHVIGYRIKSSKYTLMGLQVGCSRDAADEALRQNGYTISTEDSGGSRYTKNGVGIEVDFDKDVVTAFLVSVEVTNKENVVF